MFSRILNTPSGLPCLAIHMVGLHLQRGGRVKGNSGVDIHLSDVASWLHNLLESREEKEDKGEQEAVTTLSSVTALCSVSSTYTNHKLFTLDRTSHPHSLKPQQPEELGKHSQPSDTARDLVLSSTKFTLKNLTCNQVTNINRRGHKNVISKFTVWAWWWWWW